MVAAAKARGTHRTIRAAAERLPIAPSAVGLVVSYITLVDIEGYREAIAEIARVLKPGGAIVLSNVNFVSAATPPWVRDDDGNKLFRPINRYLEERPLHLEFFGISIINWHRPLSAYMDAFLGAGLVLERFLEPVPADESLRDDPYWEDLFRVPDFLAMRWRKPA
jgi:SAM-dependent methyltransferase